MTVLDSVIISDRVRRFSVDEYLEMTRRGILNENDNVELIDGIIVTKMARNPPHDAALGRLDTALGKALPEGWLIRIQMALVTPDSVPEPDLAVVRGPIERYDDTHPSNEDALLVVEVADSTLVDDREVKSKLYARGGIVPYWILNIPERQVEVYSDPSAGQSSSVYRSRRDVREGETVELVLPDGNKIAIAVASLLPARKVD